MEDLGVDGRIILKECVDWIHLAQDIVQRRALAYTVMNFGIITLAFIYLLARKDGLHNFLWHDLLSAINMMILFDEPPFCFVSHFMAVVSQPT